MTRDLRTSFTEPQTPQRMFKNIRHALESSRTGEQATSVKRMQSGSSSRSGRNRGVAAEAHENGEQQLKRTQSGKSSRSGRKLVASSS